MLGIVLHNACRHFAQFCNNCSHHSDGWWYPEFSSTCQIEQNGTPLGINKYVWIPWYPLWKEKWKNSLFCHLCFSGVWLSDILQVTVDCVHTNLYHNCMFRFFSLLIMCFFFKVFMGLQWSIFQRHLGIQVVRYCFSPSLCLVYVPSCHPAGMLWNWTHPLHWPSQWREHALHVVIIAIGLAMPRQWSISIFWNWYGIRRVIAGGIFMFIFKLFDHCKIYVYIITQ